MRVVKKPEERKAEMVAAAAKLFAQQGFVRTSVSEIVSAVDGRLRGLWENLPGERGKLPLSLVTGPILLLAVVCRGFGLR